MAVYEGRWYVAPSNVRIQGGGWTQERVPVDGFEPVTEIDAADVVLRNDRFELGSYSAPGRALTLAATGDSRSSRDRRSSHLAPYRSAS